MNEREEINVWVQKFKDRPALMLQWIDPETGGRKSESTKTADSAIAEQKRQEKQFELRRGLHRESSKMAWERFRETYETEKAAESADRTQTKVQSVFDSFESMMKPTNIGRITERTFSQYAAKLREKGLKPSTIKGHLAYLRAAFRWDAGQKIIAVAPTVSMPKVPKNTNRAKIQAAGRITQEEFERLLMMAPNDGWKVYLALAWFAGLRRCEARNVQGDHVDLRGHTLALPDNKAGDEAQTAVVTQELDQFLRQYWSNGVFPEGNLISDLEVTPDEHELSKQFRRIAKKAAVRGSGKDGYCVLHDLRRNFGSRWAGKVPAQVLQRMMRHANIKTTLDFYADVEKAALELLWPAQATQTTRRTNVTPNVTDADSSEVALQDESTQVR